MKTVNTLLLIIMLAGMVCAQDSPAAPIPGQYVVVLKETSAKPVVLQEVTTAGRQETYNLNQITRQANLAKLAQVRMSSGVAESDVLANYTDVIVGFTASLKEDQVAKLLLNPDVESVTPDYLIQMDIPSEEGLPGEYESMGQTLTCAVQNAGGFSTYTGADERWLWILDTGIDVDHPDLSVIDLFPYAKSFITGETYDDANGHGTHVAGIAAAKNNAIGVVGVSAGAPVVPVKVLSNAGMASMSSVLQGLNHVAQYDGKGDVVNLSLGTYPVNNCANNNLALRNAIINLGASGTWVCIASGNNTGKANQCSPGCINGTRVVTVGASTCVGACATFPNWGTTVVDWVATGVNVYSTHKNGKYATLSGTSQATPVVAGIIHLTGKAPVSGGTINCGNLEVPPAPYKKARWQ